MKSLGKIIAGLVGFLSALVGGLLLFRIRTRKATALWTLKMTASAVSPFAAVAGLMAAVLGALLRAPMAALLGLFGWAISTRYVRSVTAPHGGFGAAFGEEWQGKMSPGCYERKLSRRWSWRLPPEREPRLEQDVPFGTIPGADRQLLADIWQPPAGVEPSGVSYIYLHGSGWFTLDKDVGTRTFFRHLANQGHVVMDVSYRLYPETDMPGMIADAKRAVAWLRQNAARYGVDPRRIVLGGGSAGAHLALMAAYTPGDPRLTPEDLSGVDTSVRGVAAYYAPVDMVAQVQHGVDVFGDPRQAEDHQPGVLENALEALLRPPLALLGRLVTPASYEWYRKNGHKLAGLNQGQVFVDLMGGLPQESPEKYRQYSPITYAGPSSPPTLLLQGTDDYFIPYTSTVDLQRKLAENGVPVVAVLYPQTEHAFDVVLPEVSPVAQSAMYEVDCFLALMAGE